MKKIFFTIAYLLVFSLSTQASSPTVELSQDFISRKLRAIESAFNSNQYLVDQIIQSYMLKHKQQPDSFEGLLEIDEFTNRMGIAKALIETYTSLAEQYATAAGMHIGSVLAAYSTHDIPLVLFVEFPVTEKQIKRYNREIRKINQELASLAVSEEEEQSLIQLRDDIRSQREFFIKDSGYLELKRTLTRNKDNNSIEIEIQADTKAIQIITSRVDNRLPRIINYQLKWFESIAALFE